MQKLIDGAPRLGVGLSPRQLQQFQTYYDELVEWNKRMNLTRITDYERVQTLHFLDSLTVVLGIDPAARQEKEVASVLDVGTGAGLPGVPLKILWPTIHLTLVDSVRKKTEFLRHLVTALGLVGVTVVWGRAEELAHQAAHRERYHLVLSRALAPLPTLVELTLPFCALESRTILLKKGGMTQELQRAHSAITLLGGAKPRLCPVPAAVLPDQRLLVVIDKIAGTPPQFPRRAGVPARRPIQIT